MVRKRKAMKSKIIVSARAPLLLKLPRKSTPVKIVQHRKSRPSAWWKSTAEALSALNILEPGIKMMPKATRKPPYEEKRVAANVLCQSFCAIS